MIRQQKSSVYVKTQHAAHTLGGGGEITVARKSNNHAGLAEAEKIPYWDFFIFFNDPFPLLP